MRIVSIADRVRAACRGVEDERELRVSVLAAVRRSIGFDGYAWLLTDPETEVGSSPLAEVPCPDRLPELIGLKYRTLTNRWTELAPNRVVSLAGAASEDRSWLEFLGEYDVHDIASVAFRDAAGCWGFLDLWRQAGVFKRHELAELATALAPVTEALRLSQARMFDRAAVETAHHQPGVMLLGPDLALRRQTASADAQLRALLPTEADRRPVPAAAYNVAAQLVAAEAGISDRSPETRVAIGSGQWWTFRAARLESAGDGAEADIVVTVERTPPRDRLALYCRAHHLSARESEILSRVADGADTRTVSATLHLSEFTVQDHLKSVFAKTGVNSRRELLARALG